MTEPALQRFLGVSDTADARELLGLPPGETDAPTVRHALAAQIARVDRHPDAETPEAESVRLRLRAAARSLAVDARETLSQTRSGSPGRASTRSPFSGFQLTPFDRHVLAILVACGGWNANSRARLVAVAAQHDVSPAGLMKVVTGLARLASTGGFRVDVSQITRGEARFRAALPPPSSRGGETGSGSFAPPGFEDDVLFPELKHGGTWATIKLSILFGTITLLLGVFFVRLLLSSGDVRPPDAGPATDAPPSTVMRSPATVETTPAATDVSSPRHEVAFSGLRPTFRADPTPAAAAEAADRSGRVPELFDELARKIIVHRDLSDAHRRDWQSFNDDAALAWVLIDRGAFDAIVENAIEVLFAASDRPSATEVLINDVGRAAAEINQPIDLWRGAWAAGILGEVAGRGDTPSILRIESLNQLAALAPGTSSNEDRTFDLAALEWLESRVPDLVTRTPRETDPYLWWELWLGGLTRVADSPRFDAAVLDAVETILLSWADVSQPGPMANVLGRLIESADLERSPVVREQVSAFFRDSRIESRNLWALSSILAHDDELAPWYEREMVLQPDAGMAQRRATARQVENRWPRMEPADGRAAEGRGIQVDAEPARRWLALAEAEIMRMADEQRVVERRHEPLMHDLVRAVRLNEAASALAGRDTPAATKVLDQIEVGMTEPSSTSGARARTPPAPNQVDAPPGQARGADGVWAEEYTRAGANVQQRLELLNQLRGSAGTDLGPKDAQAFVKEVYHGSPIEIRRHAQTILMELFGRGPTIALAMLDFLPDAPANEMTSDIVAELTNRTLPSFRSESWPAAAHRALAEYALQLRTGAGDEIDRLARAMAASYIERLRFHEAAGTGQASGLSPADAVEQFASALRAQAAGLIVSDPAPAPLPAIRSRHTTRLGLAQGPIEETVAGEVMVLELLAYLASAERPSDRQKIDLILRFAANARRDAVNVLEQAIITELAIAQIWMIRFNLEDIAAGDQERGEP